MFMSKIVIACDSFKGSLTSGEVADALETGLLSQLSDCEIVKLAVGDGGEGTSLALVRALGGRIVSAVCHDPLNREMIAGYGISGNTAFIDIASASGLTLLEESKRNPLYTTTYGTGELILDAISKGCGKIILGLGGSATNDAGTGLLHALGYRFMDTSGNSVIPLTGENLIRIAGIDDSAVGEHIKSVDFVIASDVQSPFCGVNGAVNVFARQKGASDSAMEKLEQGMLSFNSLIISLFGVDMNSVKGSGAAGGAGGTLSVFLNSDIVSGVDMVLDSLHLDDIISDADLVITGEGSIDAQTLSGKLPVGVSRRCRKQSVPVVAICGRYDHTLRLTEYFDKVYDINENLSNMNNIMYKNIAKSNVISITKKIITGCLRL